MKISTEKIEGYADMTLEQKLAALEAYEVDDPDYSGYVAKEIFDKTASELSNTKKQLREKMSADEIKAKEDAEKMEELIKERDALLKEKTISGHKANYLALGYDEKLATETAEAMANGEIEKVFANQKKHNEALEKKAFVSKVPTIATDMPLLLIRFKRVPIRFAPFLEQIF